MHLGRTMIAATLAILGLQGAELKEGMPAPSFQALDQHGRTVSLADFRDKSSVILYFYPKDDTPGCTAQACSLRDGHQALQDAGAVVLGVSADDVASHKAFAQKFNLPFSLLADPGKTLIQAYGVAMPVVGMAKRVTFVIDRKGIVRR
ncbi:MAG TPA: peroxiredoxin, partial [Holophaga sp.]|nr:peroxiredoxin [Holophaga sp.]